MALYADRVKDSTSSTGTGAITLSGSAPSGYQTFGTAFGTTPQTVSYCIADQSGVNWEVGTGVFNGATGLTRTTILSSSAAGAAVNFTAGTKDVFCTAPAKYVNTLPIGLGYDSTAWPMILPSVLSSPPTLTNGVGGAASAISSSVLNSVLDGSKFTCLGGPFPRGVNYPNYLGAASGNYPQITSPSPVAIEFNFDTVDATGRFEIYLKGGGQQYRVLLLQKDGSWGAASQYAGRTMPNDGSLYFDLVTLGAAGLYTIRIEFSASTTFGIQAGPTDTISSRKTRRRRYIVVGDSYTEPTFSDSGTVFAHYGWVQQLAYLTGYDLWSAGSGGTGYVATNGSKPKYYDRLANDVLAFNPDGIIFTGGINDQSYISTISTEIDNCFSLCAGKELIVVPPFINKGIDATPSAIWQIQSILKSKAAQYGATFLDILNFGDIPYFLSGTPNFSTTLSSAYASGTSVVVSDVPAYFKTSGSSTNNWFVKIGFSAAQIVRKVSSISGTGPYTLGVTTALGTAQAIGTPVVLTGDSYQTGTGRQGATTGVGNCDRYIGPDTTHPTVAGHQNMARCVANLWAKALAGRTN